jgi:hypothetical protein
MLWAGEALRLLQDRQRPILWGVGRLGPPLRRRTHSHHSHVDAEAMHVRYAAVQLAFENVETRRMQEAKWSRTNFHVCCPLQPYPLKTEQNWQGACRTYKLCSQLTCSRPSNSYKPKPHNIEHAHTEAGSGPASWPVWATRKPQRLELQMWGRLSLSQSTARSTARYHRSLGAPMPLPRPNCRDLRALPGDCLAMPFCRSSCCCWPHSSSSSSSTNACGSTCGRRPRCCQSCPATTICPQDQCEALGMLFVLTSWQPTGGTRPTSGAGCAHNGSHSTSWSSVDGLGGQLTP